LMRVGFNMGSTEFRGRELVCYKVPEGEMRVRYGEPQTFSLISSLQVMGAGRSPGHII
jgi:hypothetical protein